MTFTGAVNSIDIGKRGRGGECADVLPTHPSMCSNRYVCKGGKVCGLCGPCTGLHTYTPNAGSGMPPPQSLTSVPLVTELMYPAASKPLQAPKVSWSTLHPGGIASSPQAAGNTLPGLQDRSPELPFHHQVKPSHRSWWRK